MELRTPERDSKLKNLHSPPSIEECSPSSSIRLVKRISGGVIRRFNSKIKASNGPDEHKLTDNTLEETPRFVCTSIFEDIEPTAPLFEASTSPPFKQITNLNRQNIPQPLSLAQLTPPSTVRKVESGSKSKYRLESPINLRRPSFSSTSSSSSGWITAKTREPRRKLFEEASNDSRSFSRPELTSRTFWNSEDELLCEQDSPTYLASVRRNISNYSESRSYIAVGCSICGEQFTLSMSGEKIIEVACGHQCHFDCYLIAFEASYVQNRFPKCGICSKNCKPCSEGVLSELTSKIITRKIRGQELKENGLRTRRCSAPSERKNGPILARSLEVSSLHSDNLKHMLPALSTPYDQLINSADVSSNGFRTPRTSRSTFYSSYEELHFNEETKTPTSKKSLKEKDVEQYTLRRPFEPRINIIPQLSKLTINENAESAIIQYVLNVYIPRLPDNMRNEENRKEHQILKKKIEQHISAQLDPNGELGQLELFDQVEFSSDGDNWTLALGVLFNKCLAFSQNGNIFACAPISEVSGVHQMDTHTLVFALKTKSLPEIYLRCEDGTLVVTKWFNYLQLFLPICRTIDTINVPLGQVTTNMWNSLPHELQKEVKERLPFIENNESQITTMHALIHQQKQSSLKIIVCLSIINRCPELHDNAKMAELLKAKLSNLIGSLSEVDELGLIVVGKNGSGEFGAAGTFIGMLSKSWGGWNDIINSLQVHNNDNIFESELHELRTMLETSRKLICAVVGSNESLQHLVILGNDNSVALSSIEDDIQRHAIESICAEITSHYGFSITQYFTRNGSLALCDVTKDFRHNISCRGRDAMATIELSELVEELRKQRLQDLLVSIESFDPAVAQIHAMEMNGALVRVSNISHVEVCVGSLKPGEAKNVLFEVQLDVEDLSQFLDSDAYVRSMMVGGDNPPPSLVRFTASWKEDGRLERSQGRSVGCDFRFGSASTAVSSLFAPALLYNHYNASNDSECLDIPLAPPLTVSREALFVVRQIQLSVIETLRICLGEENPTEVYKRLNQLISIVFCLSRNCVSTIPQYYREVDGPASPSEYAEKLCSELQNIAQQTINKTTGAVAIARWQMARLTATLVCQHDEEIFVHST